MGNVASRFKWVFGATEIRADAGAPQNLLGSTGALSSAFNTHGWGEQFTFAIDTDANATCSYQIRTGRTSSGPWSVLSSGTLNTSATDIVQVPGPLMWLSPRIKTLNSTANTVTIRMTAVES